MKRVTLLALSLMFIGAWSEDSVRAQSSAAPPVSLSPPNASPPHAGAKNAKSGRVTNDGRASPTSGGELSPPVIGRSPALPNPAADYDGFSASVDDNDVPSQVTPPARPRTAKDSSLDAASSIDQEDETLKRKLTICKNCK